MSSANLSIQFLIQKSKSLMQMRNNIDPILNPAARHSNPQSSSTLHLVYTLSELCPVTTPIIRYPVQYFPLNTMRFQFRYKSTLSNAFAKSKNITSTLSPASTHPVTLSRNSSRLVRHDRPFRKPCCESNMVIFQIVN